jgi:tRNA(fMet)-specific endonuclease VapC
MSGRYLLDTNIIIALFASDAAVKTRLAEVDEVFVCSIAIGELCFGARRSARVQDNLARVDDFASSNVVLACDTETAHRYGEIKELLRARGRPIPENDIWMAAIALQHDLILVTRDAHFEAVDGLRLAAW